MLDRIYFGEEMKEFAIISTYLIGAGEILLGLFFWKTNGHQRIRKTMAGLAIITGLWVLATVGAAYTEHELVKIILPKLTYVFGVLMVTAVLLFAILFPLPKHNFDRLHIALLFSPATLLSFIIIGTPTVIDYYVASSSMQGAWYGGPLFQYYNLYLILLYIAAIGIMVKRSMDVNGMSRHTLLPVILSFVLGGLPGVVNDLFLPLFSGFAKNPLYGTSATVIWLGVTSYIVLKK